MTMLALLCTAEVGMAGGARLVSVLLAMFFAKLPELLRKQ